MSENTLKFNNININKSEFHTPKLVVSDKFKHNEEGFKYFIGYQENE